MPKHFDPMLVYRQQARNQRMIEFIGALLFILSGAILGALGLAAAIKYGFIIIEVLK